MRIAYFINQYPAVSHTFIRREIHALEQLGVAVSRFALRPGADLVDAADNIEATRTRFVLAAGIVESFRCCAVTIVKQPLAVLSVLGLALAMSFRSDRGALRHLCYVAEAMVLAAWCRRDGVDHIHAHFGTNSAAIAMFASRLAQIPYSFTAHGPEEFEKGASLSLNTKLRHAKFAVCVSAFGSQQLKRFSEPKHWGKIAVVHCGLDPATLAVAGREPPSAPRFVCIGRLNEEKGHLTLIGAVQRLRDAGVRCEIVLAGDGPMRPRIEAAIEHAGLQRIIKLTGAIDGDRISAEIQAARALVLPSFSENLPVVLMEAMALGRPVVSTDVAGIPELVRPGKTGWLVPARDEAALAQAMQEALAAPVAQLGAMGSAGRAHVLEHHDAVKEAGKLMGLMARPAARGAQSGRLTLPDLFGAAYLINLPERRDRLKSAAQQFSRLGWRIGSGGVQIFPALRYTEAAEFPSAPVRGCYHSHLQCLRRAAAGQHSVLIMEDDVGLSASLPQMTESMHKILTNQEWDFVYFGHYGTSNPPVAHRNAQPNQLTFDAWDGEVFGAEFYAVNNRILQRLIAHLENIATGPQPMPVDGAYNVFRRQNPDVICLIARPKLGWQMAFRSDITPHTLDKLEFLRPATGLLRKFKRMVELRGS